MDYNTRRMNEILPQVMENLREHGLDGTMTKFFEMVSNNQFPLDNIAFLLWSETVKWFNNDTTTQMRYSDQTKLFWKLGWRLFGNRFLNFMGGFKHH